MLLGLHDRHLSLAISANLKPNDNNSKILKSDWLSTALISVN